MEFRLLRSFCVVAEEEHMRRAAKRLNIAQPALTQQIKMLEAELRVDLFRRVGRGLQLTGAGRLLQKEAAGLLLQAQAVAESMRLIAGSEQSTITVGISDVEMLALKITDLMKHYRTENTAVRVCEELLAPKQVAQALRDGRVDVAFSCAAMPDLHDLERCPLGAGRAVAAVPVDHPFAAMQTISLAELLSQPFVLVSHGETPGSFEVRLRKECAARNLQPHFLEITSSLLLAVNMVASGAGVALVSGDIAGLRSDAIRYIPLSDAPDLTVEFALYMRRGERSPAVAALQRLVTLHAKPFHES